MARGRLPKGLRIVSEDGTRIFAREDDIRRFEDGGGRLAARHGLRLLGLAYNPFSPEGYHLPAAEMRARLQALTPDLPVFDAVAD